MDNNRTPDKFAMDKCLYLSVMALYGIQHIIQADPVAGLIPSWIAHYLSFAGLLGVILIAALVSIYFYLKVKWGCFLLGIMITLCILFIHIPTINNNYFGASQITSASRENKPCIFCICACCNT